MTNTISIKPGRRKALKILAAGVAAVTASAFLPDKWIKPVASFGVSPVHAQSSAGFGSLIGHLEYFGNPEYPAGVHLTSTFIDGFADENGNYRIDDIPPGSYLVTAYYFHLHFEPLPVKPVVITAGGTAILDFEYPYG